MQLICTQDATASSFQDRQDRLAAHDLAPIKQFWDDYKFGKLQFLKAARPVFYSLWKARQLWRKQSSSCPRRSSGVAVTTEEILGGAGWARRRWRSGGQWRGSRSSGGRLPRARLQ